MTPPVIYILGLFEDLENRLFQDIKSSIEDSGFNCLGIELYQGKTFGSYSFAKEIERIGKIIEKSNPPIIIAHSLGGYISLQFNTFHPLLLLEPSLAIADIFLSNIRQSQKGQKYYDDGENRVRLSPKFIESLTQMPTIEKVAQMTKNKDIKIIGAGKGGYKIAEKYHINLPKSEYTLLPGANHNFSNKKDFEKINKIIKGRLGTSPSRN